MMPNNTQNALIAGALLSGLILLALLAGVKQVIELTQKWGKLFHVGHDVIIILLSMILFYCADRLQRQEYYGYNYQHY